MLNWLFILVGLFRSCVLWLVGEEQQEELGGCRLGWAKAEQKTLFK